MLKIEDKNYTVKFTIDRIKRIERALGQSFVAMVRASDGFPSIENLCVTVAYGLQDEDGNFIPFDEGNYLVEKAIVELGYNPILAEMEKALERDCPFFFQAV